jgi:hypothetical protein
MKGRAIIAALIAGFLACMCAGPGFAAIPSTITWVGWAVCPEGSTVTPVKHSRAGGYTVSVACVDSDGRSVPTNEFKGMTALFGIYFGIYFAIMLFVLLLLSTRSRAPVTPPALRQPLRPDHEQELRSLLAAGQKIQAVKRVRELTGLGLKEALDQVNWLERAPQGASSASSSLWGTPAEQSSGFGSDSADERTSEKLRELKDMLDQGLITQADYEAKKRDLLARM